MRKLIEWQELHGKKIIGKIMVLVAQNLRERIYATYRMTFLDEEPDTMMSNQDLDRCVRVAMGPRDS